MSNREIKTNHAALRGITPTGKTLRPTRTPFYLDHQAIGTLPIKTYELF